MTKIKMIENHEWLCWDDQGTNTGRVPCWLENNYLTCILIRRCVMSMSVFAFWTHLKLIVTLFERKKNPQGEWLWTETRSLSSGQWCHGSPAHSDELLPFGCDLFFCLVYNTEEENKDVMLRCRSSVSPLWSSTDSSLPQRQIAQEACVGTNLCLVYSWKWYMFFPICKLHLTLIKWL